MLGDMHSFRDLHTPGHPLIMPNPWDVGSAKILASMGFKALATSSAGFAHSIGRADAARAVSRDEAIAHTRDLVAATPLPINADLERCFADDPSGVAETITLAGATGAAGGSIEDATGTADDPIYTFDLAVERVEAAVAAARRLDSDFVLTARAEGFLWGRPDLNEVIRRLRAFESVGADVLYAPGLPDLDAVREVTRAVTAPVNILPSPAMTVADLADAGVARVSVGSAMSRAAYGAVIDAGREILSEGTFTYGDAAASFAMLNTMFSD